MLPQKVINDPKKNLNLNIMTLRKCIILFKKMNWNLLLLKLLPQENQILLFKSFTDTLYGPY